MSVSAGVGCRGRQRERKPHLHVTSPKQMKLVSMGKLNETFRSLTKHLKINYVLLQRNLDHA